MNAWKLVKDYIDRLDLDAEFTRADVLGVGNQGRLLSVTDYITALTTTGYLVRTEIEPEKKWKKIRELETDLSSVKVIKAINAMGLRKWNKRRTPFYTSNLHYNRL